MQLNVSFNELVRLRGALVADQAKRLEPRYKQHRGMWQREIDTNQDLLLKITKLLNENTTVIPA